MKTTAKEKVKVKDSKVAGKGLFSAQPIASGETVMRIKGEVFSLRKFFAATQAIRDNTIRIAENNYISPAGEMALYLNHSCNPNCKIVKRGEHLYLVALKDIPANKELAFDYSTTIAQDDYWIMKCSCGTKQCRVKIKRYNLLPKELLQNYIERKIIPQYILDIPK